MAVDIRGQTQLVSALHAREPGQRALELDVLRGAGALAVVVIHASATPLSEESALGQASWMLLVPNVAARFAVPVFMILSGMGLTLSARRSERYAQFLWRRLTGIVPAYVVWTVIYGWLLPKHEVMTVQTVVTDLLTGHASNHLYFVPALVRLYLLYPVMSYFARVPCGVASCCALSWSTIWLSPILASTALGAFLDELLPLRWMGFFVLGIWLANERPAESRSHSRLERARALSPLVVTASLGCMLAIVRRVTTQDADIDAALGAAEPFIFPYSVGVLLWSTGAAFSAGPLVRILTFVSDRSYGVYLSHMLTLHVSTTGLQAFVGQSTYFLMFAGGALGLALALAIATLSDRAKRALFRGARAAKDTP